MKTKNSNVRYNNPHAVTPVEYRAFQQAYDFFNKELFSASLPQVLITLHRRAHSKGYFAPKRFSGRLEESNVHELALNPDTFIRRTDEEILSTLAHEMVHVWQQTHGKAPRRAYHDRQWANKMKEIGLQPSSTGQPDGKETGQSVTHYILAEGAYQKAYRTLQARGFQLHWQSAPPLQKRRESKLKFTCPECRQNAWAKPDAELICGICRTQMI